MSEPKTAVVCSEASLCYEHRPGYLEAIERYRAVMLRLEESGLIQQVQRLSGRLAERVTASPPSLHRTQPLIKHTR